MCGWIQQLGQGQGGWFVLAGPLHQRLCLLSGGTERLRVSLVDGTRSHLRPVCGLISVQGGGTLTPSAVRIWGPECCYADRLPTPTA